MVHLLLGIRFVIAPMYHVRWSQQSIQQVNGAVMRTMRKHPIFLFNYLIYIP